MLCTNRLFNEYFAVVDQMSVSDIESLVMIFWCVIPQTFNGNN
jgi:hypothetical protein